MIRILLASAAAVALSAGALQAQFLLVPDDNDHKQVVNQWAGATHSNLFERSAVSALRLPADGLPAIVNQLTPGAPLGSDAFDHKAVAGENLHAF